MGDEYNEWDLAELDEPKKVAARVQNYLQTLEEEYRP